MRRPVLRYALAVAVVAAAALLRWAFPGILAGTPFLAFYPAVVAAAIFGGFWPGLLATIGSALCVDVLFTAPYGWFSLNDPVEMVRLAIFVAGGAGISAIAGMSKAAQTRQRRQTLDLKESEERFRGTFENAAVGIAHLDAEGRFLRVNEKLREILGYRCENLRGLTFKDITDPEIGTPDAAQYPLLMRGELGTYSVEKRYVRRDGQSMWVAVTRSLQRDAAGRPAYSIAIVEDISKRKETERHLAEVNQTLEQRVAERTAEVEKQLEQLRTLTTELTLAEHRERQRLAKVLHDNLQQLLVSSKFHVSIAQSQVGDPAVRESLAQIDKLLDDSLQASRSLTTELFPAILHSGKFADVLGWLIQWMREKHDLQVHMRADELTDPPAEEIRLLLFEATRELLFNIVKHAGVREACLEMAGHNGSQMRITIADSGKGFDPASVHAAHRTEGGFGMANIQERLRLLGGSIEVQSVPGHGTRATLLAPMRP